MTVTEWIIFILLITNIITVILWQRHRKIAANKFNRYFNNTSTLLVSHVNLCAEHFKLKIDPHYYIGSIYIYCDPEIQKAIKQMDRFEFEALFKQFLRTVVSDNIEPPIDSDIS